MPIQFTEVALPARDGALPTEVQKFLDEATRRIDAFQVDAKVPGFVASDFAGAYSLLRGIAEGYLAPGQRFCEWGSGFGVVACLASIVGFDACGIEIEPALVNEARRLASDFDLPVAFFAGSYLPRGGSANVDVVETSWFDRRENDDDAMPDVSDFDVIFAYPWPDEAILAERLFAARARRGALLATYATGGGFRLRRKTGR
jgi:hypothetical protein